MTTADVVSKARAKLLLGSQPSAAFLATLAMALVLVPTTSIPTAATDGTSLLYNLKFMLSLLFTHALTVVAHEVLHCALLHPYRRGNRDPKLYNIAADHVVNLLLLEWGFEPVPGWICDPKYKGMSVEQIYAKLFAENPPAPNQGQGKGQGAGGNGQKQPKPGSQGQPGGKPQERGVNAPQSAPGAGKGDSDEPLLPGCPTGEFRDAPEPADLKPGDPKPMSAEDWSILAEQAALAARKAGMMPGSLEAELRSIRTPDVDWRELLREYTKQSIPTSQSWTKPNRRYVSGGLYLPGAIKDSIGPVVIFQDTSLSMWGPILQLCGDQITNIVEEIQPERVIVAHIDTEVRGTEEYEPGDQVILRPKGAGGTMFQPAFDWLESQEIEPLVVIYLTDLENGDRGQLREPGVPVIWATPRWVTREPEFGKVVRVDAV